MRPAEILDAQADLLHRLQHDELFREFTAIPAEGMLTGKIANSLQPLPEDMNVHPNGDIFVEALGNYVAAAYAYRVTHDMCLVLDHAANSLDEGDLFSHENAPTGCGFVRFDRPIKVVDMHGKTMLVHWAIWGPATVEDGPGLAFAFYNDVWTEPDEVWGDLLESFAKKASETSSREFLDDKMLRAIGRWMSVHQTATPTGSTLGPSQIAPDIEQQVAAVGQGKVAVEATNLIRYMHALFLLLNQTITKVEDEYPDRAGRRRAEKRGLPAKVTVIKLRRTEGTRQEGESLIEWSHRWVVRGHWAWRKCGPEKQGAQEYEKGWRTRVWIAPYQKGPEDAPLIITDKVYSLDR